MVDMHLGQMVLWVGQASVCGMTKWAVLGQATWLMNGGGQWNGDLGLGWRTGMRMRQAIGHEGLVGGW